MKTLLLISVDLKKTYFELVVKEKKKQLFIGLQLNSIGCLGDHSRSFVFIPFCFSLPPFLLLPPPPPFFFFFFKYKQFCFYSPRARLFCLITKVYSGVLLVSESKALPERAVCFISLLIPPSPPPLFFFLF